MKIIAVIGIVALSYLFGRTLSSKYMLRFRLLEAFRTLAADTRADLNRNMTIPESFADVHTIAPLDELVKRVGKRIKNDPSVSFNEIWAAELAALKDTDISLLNKSEISLIRSISAGLFDENAYERVKSKLDDAVEASKTACPQKTKLSMSLSILCGLLAAILVI